MVEAFLFYLQIVKGYLHLISVYQRLLASNLRIFFQLMCFRRMFLLYSHNFMLNSSIFEATSQPTAMSMAVSAEADYS